MSGIARSNAVFLILGIAFIAVGASGQKVFLFVGLAFLAIGIAGAARRRS